MEVWPLGQFDLPNLWQINYWN